MEEACGTGRGTNMMNSNASLSLADLSLPRRISTLIAMAGRFGPVLPVFGVVAVEGNWMCECGEASCKAGKHRSEEHTSELQSLRHLVCRLLLEKKTYLRPRCRRAGFVVLRCSLVLAANAS